MWVIARASSLERELPRRGVTLAQALGPHRVVERAGRFALFTNRANRTNRTDRTSGDSARTRASDPER